MGERSDWMVICPFYIGEKSSYIKCEGLVGINTTNWFPNLERVNEYKEKYCKENYKDCPLTKVLEKKYN